MIRARHAPGTRLPQRVPAGTLSWPREITGNKLRNSRNVLQLPTESTLLLLSALGACITSQVKAERKKQSATQAGDFYSLGFTVSIAENSTLG